jgi:putative transposase
LPTPITNHLHYEVLRPPVEFAQYTAIRYTERLAEACAVRSVGSKGDSYDNAMAESFNGLYKTELIYKDGPWAGLSDVEFATLEWVDWFNNRRLHSEIGMVPPAEYEAAFRPLMEAQTA